MPTIKYTPSTADVAKVEKAFTFHPVQGDQAERYPLIRAKAKELAYFLMEQCPPSRELSVALTELQSSVMWANAAIAINEDKADQP
jgi:hypothetical protein